MEASANSAAFMNALLRLGVLMAGPKHAALFIMIQDGTARATKEGSGLISPEIVRELLSPAVVTDWTQALTSLNLLELELCIRRILLVHKDRGDLEELREAVQAAQLIRSGVYDIDSEGEEGEESIVEESEYKDENIVQSTKHTENKTGSVGGKRQEALVKGGSKAVDTRLAQSNDSKESRRKLQAEGGKQATRKAASRDKNSGNDYGRPIELQASSGEDSKSAIQLAGKLFIAALTSHDASARVLNKSTRIALRLMETYGTVLPDSSLELLETTGAIQLALAEMPSDEISELVTAIKRADLAESSGAITRLRALITSESAHDMKTHNATEIAKHGDISRKEDEPIKHKDTVGAKKKTRGVYSDPPAEKIDDSKPAIQLVGRLLSAALNSNPSAKRALKKTALVSVRLMENYGTVIPASTLEALESTGALRLALVEMPFDQVWELEIALKRALEAEPSAVVKRLGALFTSELVHVKRVQNDGAVDSEHIDDSKVEDTPIEPKKPAGLATVARKIIDGLLAKDVKHVEEGPHDTDGGQLCDRVGAVKVMSNDEDNGLQPKDEVSKLAIQLVGKMFNAALTSNDSSASTLNKATRVALRLMETYGTVLPDSSLEALETTGAIRLALTEMSLNQISELKTALDRAGVAGKRLRSLVITELACVKKTDDSQTPNRVTETFGSSLKTRYEVSELSAKRGGNDEGERDAEGAGDFQGNRDLRREERLTVTNDEKFDSENGFDGRPGSHIRNLASIQRDADVEDSDSSSLASTKALETPKSSISPATTVTTDAPSWGQRFLKAASMLPELSTTYGANTKAPELTASPIAPSDQVGTNQLASTPALETLLRMTDDVALQDKKRRLTSKQQLDYPATSATSSALKIFQASSELQVSACDASTQYAKITSEFVKSVESGVLLPRERLALALDESVMDEILYTMSVDTVDNVIRRLRLLIEADQRRGSNFRSQTSSLWYEVLVSLRLCMQDAVDSGRVELSDQLISAVSIVEVLQYGQESPHQALRLPQKENFRGQDAKLNVQIVGKLLNQALTSSQSAAQVLSPTLRFHIQRMETKGIALSNAQLRALEDSRAMRLALPEMPRELVLDLEAALAHESSNLLMVKLWLLFNRDLAQVKLPGACEETADIEKIDEVLGVNDLVEAASEIQKQIAAFVLLTLSISSQLTDDMSAELQEEVATMKELGTALSDESQAELLSVLPHIVEVLPNAELRKFQDAVRKAEAGGVASGRVLSDGLQMCIDDAVADGRDFLQIASASTVVQGGIAMSKKVGASVFELKDAFSSNKITQELANSYATVEKWSKASRQEVDAAIRDKCSISMSELGKLWATLPLIRIDLLRNYIQSSGLLFYGLFDFRRLHAPIMRLIEFVYSWVYRVLSFSFIFQFAYQGVAVLGVILFCLTLIGYVVFLALDFGFDLTKTKHVVREGHAAVTWASIARTPEGERRLRHFGHLLFIFLTIHFPITQFGLETMAVKNAMVGKAFGMHHKTYVFFQVLCGFFFVLFCCSFPFFLVYKIRANALKEKDGKTFDIDGRPVHLEGHVFTRLVTRHPNHVHCPYKSLYRGYEHKYRYYKLLQLLLRFLLLLPIISTPNVSHRTS